MKLTISLCLALAPVKLSYRQFVHSFYSWRALATCVAFCTVCACAADSPFSGIAEVAVRIGEAAQPDGFYRDILGFDRLPNDASGNAR